MAQSDEAGTAPGDLLPPPRSAAPSWGPAWLHRHHWDYVTGMLRDGPRRPPYLFSRIGGQRTRRHSAIEMTPGADITLPAAMPPRMALDMARVRWRRESGDAFCGGVDLMSESLVRVLASLRSPAFLEREAPASFWSPSSWRGREGADLRGGGGIGLGSDRWRRPPTTARRRRHRASRPAASRRPAQRAVVLRTRSEGLPARRRRGSRRRRARGRQADPPEVPTVAVRRNWEISPPGASAFSPPRWRRESGRGRSGSPSCW